MSILIRQEKIRKLLVLEVVGEPGLEEFRRVARQAEAESLFWNALWDLSRGRLSHLDTAEFEELVEMRTNFERHCEDGRKTAVYAPTDTEFGLVRMLEGLSPEGQTPLRVFKKRSDAMEWLNS